MMSNVHDSRKTQSSRVLKLGKKISIGLLSLFIAANAHAFGYYSSDSSPVVDITVDTVGNLDFTGLNLGKARDFITTLDFVRVYGGAYSSGTMFDAFQWGVKEKILSGVYFEGPYKAGERNSGEWKCLGGCIATVRVGSNEEGYYGELKEQTGERVTIEGTKKEPARLVKTAQFNSPNIYIENALEGNIGIELNSEWGTYRNQRPNFNRENGWTISVKNQELKIKNEKVDHLYYELGMKKVKLSRNGQNFETKEALVNFLKTSEFFQSMGMSATEKQNALAYVLPQIPTSPNYYLTILNNPEQITQLEITPAAKVIQRYFVIYPTTIPVTTTGGLVYPKSIEGKNEFIVKNYGEIIIKPNMFVVWE